MFLNTQAIVLHTTKHTDNSVILHAYTKENGRMTFMINGIKSKKCVFRSAFHFPLSILELEIDYNHKKDIHRIKEGKISYAFCGIPFDPIKNSIAFLLSEVLFRGLRETEKNDPLFNFLFQSIILLDNTTESTANFHLVFLVKLSYYLGFYPNDNDITNTYFDMLNGCFVSQKPIHNSFLPLAESNMLKELLCNNFETMCSLGYSHKQRNEILKQLLHYYRLHLAEFGQIKSMEVLQTLFK